MERERILIKDLHQHKNKQVKVCGWVEARRDHGKLIFFVIRDRSSQVQAVINAKNESAFSVAEKLKDEWVVCISGEVKERPEKMVKDEENGDIELSIDEIEILSSAKELPFEKDTQLNIETHLDHLPLTLRKREISLVFKLQSALLEGFRSTLREDDFVEFASPSIVGGDAEGGAGVFKVEYFKDKTAYLATSPQLYKQILVGVFERVFATGKAFRAEKHATTRHLSEYTSLDFEMGFIKDHTDVMAQLQKVVKKMIENVWEKHGKELEEFKIDKPLVPEGDFPTMTMREAQELILKEVGRDNTAEPDLEPEDERFLCKYSAEQFGSDFIFITHYPTSKRPFYTYRDEKNPEYTKSFDLLFRGVEIATGGQRVHDYDLLVEQIKEKNLDPDKFKFYLQAFRFGMPPHGGVGMGLERITAKLAGIKNVKEATLFPRDMTRIDLPLADN